MYSIKKVSELTGIAAVTIRAWERRYGLNPSERTNGGHRLYTDEDVYNLNWLKRQTEEAGVNISQAVQLLLQRKTQTEIQSNSEREKRGVDPSGLDLLYKSLTAFDSTKANEALELCFATLPIDSVTQTIFPELLSKIGGDRDNGNISVAQEHFASNWIMHRISHLSRVFPINQSYPKAIALCPPDEHHQIGLHLFTLFLRKKGMDALYLGPDTPIDGLDQMLEQLDIGLVCVSFTRAQLQPYVNSLLNHLSSKHPTLKFALGGQGMDYPSEALKQWKIGNSPPSWSAWFEQEWERTR